MENHAEVCVKPRGVWGLWGDARCMSVDIHMTCGVREREEIGNGVCDGPRHRVPLLLLSAELQSGLC